MSQELLAGVDRVSITPTKPMFLFGYPHVERVSEGVHDPLYASAVVLDNGETVLAMCACDLIFVSKAMAAEARRRISEATGIPGANVLISATHTHSGPITVDMISNRGDTVVPKADREYVAWATGAIARAVVQAYESRRPAELALTVCDAAGVGGNRREDGAAADPEVPALVVRDQADRRVTAVLTAYCMHPTVLHEDSRLVSADFPGCTRTHVEDALDGAILVYHTGPEGNQSPRRFVAANTFAEAERLGRILGERIVEATRSLNDDDFRASVALGAASSDVMLERRAFPSVEDAEAQLAQVVAHFEQLRREGAPASDVRTAECDVFGAEEAVTMARCAKDGSVDRAAGSALPAELQVLRVGDTCFVGLPGELFVEYSLQIKREASRPAFVIALANGELQGYIVTEDAAAEGGYEAWNGLFPPAAGDALVAEALNLIEKVGP